MRDAALYKSGSLVLLLALAACTEPTTPPANTTDATGIQAATVPGNCDLVGSMPGDVRDFFGSADQKAATGQVKLIGDACNAGNQAAVTALSWQLLGLMETVLNQHQAQNAAAGNPLTNKLLACTQSLCNSAALPGIDFGASLAARGLFAVRGPNADDALARDPVPFIDFLGNANNALWGVEVDAPWSTVTGVSYVLVYGSSDNTLTLQELPIGNLRYDLKTFPDVAFADDQLHVGVCFDSEIEVPDVSGAPSVPAMRREGVLLQASQPGFCGTVQSASLLGSVSALARRLMPAALRSWLLGTPIRGVGGGASDFSRFAPVAANAAGNLEFVVGPDPVVVEGQSIGVLQVRARSGDGTAMEGARVTVSLFNNRGEPAGAVLSGDTESTTQELNGGVAVFPDDGDPLVVGKPGGYSLCANADLGGFTFAAVCTRLHVRSR
jgi:hypothetical protein